MISKFVDIDTQFDEHVNDKEIDLKVDKQIQILSRDIQDVKNDLCNCWNEEVKIFANTLGEKEKNINDPLEEQNNK